MPYRKYALTMMGVHSDFDLVKYMFTLLMATYTILSGAYRSFGFSADIFFVCIAGEYVIGQLAYKRRGTWERKKAIDGLVTISVMVILLCIVQACTMAAKFDRPIAAWLAIFWGFTAFRGAVRNAYYLGVKPVPGLTASLDWITAKISKLLFPLDKLREMESQGKTDAGVTADLNRPLAVEPGGSGQERRH